MNVAVHLHNELLKTIGIRANTAVALSKTKVSLLKLYLFPYCNLIHKQLSFSCNRDCLTGLKLLPKFNSSWTFFMCDPQAFEQWNIHQNNTFSSQQFHYIKNLILFWINFLWFRIIIPMYLLSLGCVQLLGSALTGCVYLFGTRVHFIKASENHFLSILYNPRNSSIT